MTLVPWYFLLWMIPWVGIALAILYGGYVAYEASLAREVAASAPLPGPDPVLELERINTEIGRISANTRKSLESARDAMQRGLRG